MKTGDVLFYKGASLFSRVIRYFTNSPYTHVTLVVGMDNDGTPLVLEAQRFKTTTIRRLEPTEEFEIYRPSRLTDKQAFMIRTLSQDYVGRRYDYLEMVGLVIRSMFDGKRTILEKTNRDYCSEIIDVIFYIAGIERSLDVHVGDAYPHELIDLYNLDKVDDKLIDHLKVGDNIC